MTQYEDQTEPELPELQSAVLNERQLNELFADLAAHTEIESVRLKAGSRAGAADETVSIDQAREAFVSGHCTGVQIRYMHKGQPYTDTLLRTEVGFRLIRM